MNDYKFWDELGNIFNAVLAYQQKTIEFNKRFVAPWIQLGPVFDPQEDNLKTVSARKQAVEIDPDNAENFLALGDAYFKNGHMDEAAGAYAHAIELNPQVGWAYANLALVRVTSQHYEEAVGLYQRSLEFITDQKDRAMIWNRLGNAYRKLNDYDNACIAFKMADECDAGNTGFTDLLDAKPVEAQDPESAGVDVPSSPIPEESEAIAAEMIEEASATGEEQPAVTETEIEEVLVASGPEATAQLTTAEELVTEVVEVPEQTAEVVAETAVEELPAVEVQPVAEEATEQQSTVEVEDVEETVAAVEVTMEIVEPEASTGSQEVAAEESVTRSDETPVTGSVTETTITPMPVHGNETITPAVTLEETEVVVLNQDEPSLTVEAAVETIVESAVESPVEVEDAQAESQSEVQAEATEGVEVTAKLETQTNLESEAAQAVEPVSEMEVPGAPATEADEESNESIVQEILTLIDKGNPQDDELPDFLKQPTPEPAEEQAAEPVTDHKDAQFEPDTKNAHVWNELGNVYFDTGAYEEAVTAYTRAIELDVRFAWPYSNLALTYVQKEKYEEAVLLYQRSIELFDTDKDKAVTFNRLGNVYRRMNDYDNAIASYQRADELDPNNATRSLRSRFSLLGSMNMEFSQNLAM